MDLLKLVQGKHLLSPLGAGRSEREKLRQEASSGDLSDPRRGCGERREVKEPGMCLKTGPKEETKVKRVASKKPHPIGLQAVSMQPRQAFF